GRGGCVVWSGPGAPTADQGTVTGKGEGTRKYPPNADYNGPDTIHYTMTDNGTTNGVADPKTASGTIAVTVTEVSDAPRTATVGAQTTAEDTAINSIDVLSGASKGPANESGQTLSVVSSGPGAPTADHGTVTVNGDGTL